MRAAKARALLGVVFLLLLVAGVAVALRRGPQVACRIALLRWQSSPVWKGGGCRLAPGRSVQAEFRAEHPPAFHAYKIHLEAGQSLGLVVDQDEVDVSATLWSLERKILLEVDVLIGGAEHLYFVAPSAGEYGLVVRPEERGQSGRYRVLLRPPRPATRRDRKRAEAARLLAMAEQHHREGEDTHAIPLYGQSRDLWRSLGDSGAETEVAYKLGLIKLQRQGGLEDLERGVLPRWKGSLRESRVLTQIGENVLFYEHDAQRAQGYYRRALSSVRRHRDEMRVFNDLIHVYRAQGDIQRALNAFGTARDLARSNYERSELAGTVAELFLSMGDYERAVEFADKSLSLLPDDFADSGLRVVTLRTKGIAEYLQGRSNDALKTLGRALDLARSATSDPGYQALVLNAIGTAYVEKYEREQPGDPRYLRKASEDFEAARRYSQRAGDAYSNANAAAYQGRIRDLQGREADAVAFYGEAYEGYSALRVPLGMAGSLNGRARARQELRQLREARADSEQAIQILEQVRSDLLSSELRAIFLSAWRSLFEVDAELLVDLDEQIPDSGYVARAFEKTEELRARTLLEIMVAHGQKQQEVEPDLQKKVQRVEARLRELNPQLLLPPEMNLRPRSEGIEAEAREGLVELEILRASLSEKSAPVELPTPLSVSEIQRRLLDEDTLILAYMLGQTRSLVWVIDAHSIKVYPLKGRREIEEKADRVATLLARSDPQNRWQEAVAAAQKLSGLVLLPVAGRLEGKRLVILRDGSLYRIPFEALPDPRGPRKKVAPGTWPTALNEHNEVLYEPSASVATEIREQSRKRSPAPKRFAGFGDPVFRPDDDRLAKSKGTLLAGWLPPSGQQGAPGRSTRLSRGVRELERLQASGNEVEQISRLFPAGQSLKLLGFDARRERVLDGGLDDYGILHFATHSLLDPSFPELSSLVFSLLDRQGRPQDGFLSFYEISNLDLPVEMVVLSACRTAVGEESPSEGVIGLGRAFLHAGASRVVVSLWDVDDGATSALMDHFYRGIKRGLGPAAALREARLWVSRQPGWAAPYYWAPFVLEGDWHPLAPLQQFGDDRVSTNGRTKGTRPGPGHHERESQKESRDARRALPPADEDRPL